MYNSLIYGKQSSSDWVPDMGLPENDDEVGQIVPEGEPTPSDDFIKWLDSAPRAEPIAASAGRPPAPPANYGPAPFYLICRHAFGGKVFAYAQTLQGGDILALVARLREEDEFPNATLVYRVDFDGLQDVSLQVARVWWAKIGSDFRWGMDQLPRMIDANLPEVSRHHAALQPQVTH